MALRALALLGLLLPACLPVAASPEPVPPTPTATQTSTPPPTATIVWFPPTATFTPAPTRLVEPTQDMRVETGDLLLEDDFSDTAGWQTGRTASGSVAYGNNELTLAVSEERGALLSLRKSTHLTDFYLEIDALPSLCRGSDAYGLLLRAESGADFYRLMLTCSGQLRLERVKNSRFTVLQDWVTSGQIIPGGMMPVRIGVWARGEELRVFINSEYQFSMKDPVFTAGTVGLYARAAGDTPLTVSFSNMQIRSLEGIRLSTPAPTRPAP